MTAVDVDRAIAVLEELAAAASPGLPRQLPEYAESAPQRTVYLKAGRVTNVYGLGGYFAQSDARLSLTLVGERGAIQVLSTDAVFIDGDGRELVLMDATLAALAPGNLLRDLRALSNIRSEYASDIRKRVCDTNIAFYVSEALTATADAIMKEAKDGDQ